MTAAYNSDVTVTVRFAYGQDVYDTTPTWTDETSDVLGFTVRRGKNRRLDQVQPGQATIRLLNTSGDYSPWNTAGANSPNVNVLTKVNIRATHNMVDYDLFTGYAVAWLNTWDHSGHYPIVEVQAVDGFTLLAMFEAELTEATEMSGARVGNLLDTAGWPAAWRDLDAGTHNVAALSAEFDNILGELYRVALVEDGLFWIAGNGDATFRDGVTRHNATVAATLSDDGAGVDYRHVRVDYDTTQLWNSATVTRADGEPQTATDATSVAAYGRRDLHLSETLNVADGEAQAFADWLVAEFKDVRSRVPEVTLTPEKNPTVLWPEALGRELLDKVNAEVTTIAGDDFDEDCYIEGVAHNVNMVGTRFWETGFQLSPDLPFTDWWVLGVSELGVDTRLAY